MDHIDENILELLKKNGKVSATDISKVVGQFRLWPKEYVRWNTTE